MKGPRYTFFSDNTIYLVLRSAAHASLVEQSEILQHQPLNTSDHLLDKIDTKWSTEGNDAAPPPQKIRELELRDAKLQWYTRPCIGYIWPIYAVFGQ